MLVGVRLEPSHLITLRRQMRSFYTDVIVFEIWGFHLSEMNIKDGGTGQVWGGQCLKENVNAVWEILYQ